MQLKLKVRWVPVTEGFRSFMSAMVRQHAEHATQADEALPVDVAAHGDGRAVDNHLRARGQAEDGDNLLDLESSPTESYSNVRKCGIILDNISFKAGSLKQKYSSDKQRIVMAKECFYQAAKVLRKLNRFVDQSTEEL